MIFTCGEICSVVYACLIVTVYVQNNLQNEFSKGQFS